MNKQIISLMCVALLLALALVLANEKWPDGYRTAPQVNVDTTPVGAVVKGPVTLPEKESSASNTATAANDNVTVQQSSGANSQNQGQKTAPQGELVAIDSGTLRGDVPTISAASETSPKTDVASTNKAASDTAVPKADTTPKAEPTPPKTPEKAAPAPKPEVKKESTPKTTTAILGKATPKILLYTQEAVLEIKATAPIRCKTFTLANPHRLVVDLIGKWDVPSTSVPSNTIIQRIRVGEASERTRIVLDLKRALKADKIVQVNATTINVRMQ